MKKVAPTGGCQAIIHHWARFMKWDNEKFFNFIIQALEKTPSNRPIRDKNGELTPFGKRKNLWEYGLNHTKT